MQPRNPMQCGAKTRTGEPCKAKAMDNGRCRMHGGATPSGIASPHYKTGGRSKYLPARLAARYNDARNDPDLLTLHNDVATVDTRLSELLERVSDDDPRVLWEQAKALLNRLEDAQKRGSREQVTLVDDLRAVIADGIANPNGATWRDIFDILETRRRLVDSEVKRQQILQQMIPAESAVLLIGLIESIIKRHVTDPAQLAAIAKDVGQLATQPVGRIIDAE